MLQRGVMRKRDDVKSVYNMCPRLSEATQGARNAPSPLGRRASRAKSRSPSWEETRIDRSGKAASLSAIKPVASTYRMKTPATCNRRSATDPGL